MASGGFYVNTSNEYIRGEVTWSSTIDVANNRSAVTVTLKFSRTNTGYTTIRTPACTIRIGESSTSYTEYACDENGSSITITYLSHTFCGDATRNVAHNADGTGSCYIRIAGVLEGSTDYALTTTAQTVTLDTIPRASVITAFPAFEIGSGSVVNLLPVITSYAGSFNLDFKLAVGATVIVDYGTSGWTDIAASGGSGQTVSLALSTAQQLGNQFGQVGRVLPDDRAASGRRRYPDRGWCGNLFPDRFGNSHQD